MKVNTVKLLQAGGYVTYQPLPMAPQPQPQQQAPQEQQADEGYLDKGILDKMLGKGITTDVMQYSQQLQQAYQQYQTMSDLQRNSYKGRQIRQMLKGDLGSLNALIRAKDTFDDSIKNAKSNDSLDEYAVTSNGMVVRNNETGKIDSVSFSEYAKDNGGEGKKYTALTNAQLAEQREYNKDLINNSAVFNVLNFGKGMSKIQEEVYKIVGSIGRTSNTVANGSFTTGDAQDVKELMQAARAGAFKIKSGESDETNQPQIEAAKHALWTNLSENSKAVLRARAASMTNSPGDIDKLAYNMMASLLDPHTTTETRKTYDETLTKAGKLAGGSDKMAKVGPYGMAFSGGSDNISLTQIGPQGARINGVASAIPADAYRGKDNTLVPLANAGKLASISYISKAFTANGDKVDPNLTVVTGDAYHTQLPYTRGENGEYKIDEEGAKKYAEYEQALKAHNIPKDSAQAAQVAQDMGVQNLQIGHFVVAEASSYADHFFNDRDKNYYEEVGGVDKDALKTIVDPDGKITHHYGFFNNDAHKHLIFIPAKSMDKWNSLDGNDAKVPESVYEIGRGYNTGPGGMDINKGTTLNSETSARQMGLTKDSFQ